MLPFLFSFATSKCHNISRSRSEPLYHTEIILNFTLHLFTNLCCNSLPFAKWSFQSVIVKFLLGVCLVPSDLCFETIDPISKLRFKISHEQSPLSDSFTVLDGLDLLHEILFEEHGQFEVQLCVSQLKVNTLQTLLCIFSRPQEFQHPSQHCSQIRSLRL